VITKTCAASCTCFSDSLRRIARHGSSRRTGGWTSPPLGRHWPRHSWGGPNYRDRATTGALVLTLPSRLRLPSSSWGSPSRARPPRQWSRAIDVCPGPSGPRLPFFPRPNSSACQNEGCPVLHDVAIEREGRRPYRS
jgi:hypothetical protein